MYRERTRHLRIVDAKSGWRFVAKTTRDQGKRNRVHLTNTTWTNNDPHKHPGGTSTLCHWYGILGLHALPVDGVVESPVVCQKCLSKAEYLQANRTHVAIVEDVDPRAGVRASAAHLWQGRVLDAIYDVQRRLDALKRFVADMPPPDPIGLAPSRVRAVPGETPDPASWEQPPLDTASYFGKPGRVFINGKEIPTVDGERGRYIHLGESNEDEGGGDNEQT